MSLLAMSILLSGNAPANSGVDTSMHSPMGYYFGALALTALVMTWLWLWLRTRETLKARQAQTQPENAE